MYSDQCLLDLAVRIQCLNDQIHDGPKTHSKYFFIENTFYDDMSKESCIPLSKLKYYHICYYIIVYYYYYLFWMVVFVCWYRLVDIWIWFIILLLFLILFFEKKSEVIKWVKQKERYKEEK